MKKWLLIPLFFQGLVPSLKAQDDLLDKFSIALIERKNSDIFYIDPYYDIPMPQEKLVKQITVEKQWFQLTTKPAMLANGIDSTRHYGGNCFKMTYFDYSDTLRFDRGHYLMKGEIYRLDSAEIAEIRSRMAVYKSPEDIKKREYREARAALPVVYDVNMVLQFGGESKFAFWLPKFNVMRKHQLQFATPYYGAEIGPHMTFSFIPWYGSISAIAGIEKSFFSTETSLSHFVIINAHSQTLWNLKVGFGIEQGRIKIGRSFLLQESGPTGEERNSLLDAGKINGQIWGIELQFRLNNKE
ncbi:MAG TPA: hypothetical protein VEC36_03230 [Patescibacteria group bacterium]|nr:hypothetical protein [Patescibacteria group bacterium]